MGRGGSPLVHSAVPDPGIREPLIGTDPIQGNFAEVDDILESFKGALGDDRPRYRNHVYRDLSYFAALQHGGGAIPRAVQIAAAFHDIGIWTAATFDYLGPSVQQATIYLQQCNLAHLGPEVTALIEQHHKLSRYCGCFASVEVYRRADTVDVTLGLRRFGLSRSLVRDVQQMYPTLGFHRMLAQLTARQWLRTPWRPLPMVRL